MYGLGTIEKKNQQEQQHELEAYVAKHAGQLPPGMSFIVDKDGRSRVAINDLTADDLVKLVQAMRLHHIKGVVHGWTP
jgi:hypothetical protein